MSTDLVLGPEHARGHTLQRVHQFGELHRRWVFDQEVDVIVLPVHLGQGCAEVLAHVGEHGSQVVQVLPGEHSPAVLRHKDQMSVDQKDTSSPTSIIAIVAHRPSILGGMAATGTKSEEERKPRARTRPKDAPTHVVSVPLRLTPAQRSMEDARFEAARRVYNACLGESLRRCRKTRSDPAFDLAKAMPKGRPRSKASVARNRAFRAVADAHGFTEDSMMSFASGLRNGWVRDQVPSQEAQILGRRVFRATKRWSLGLGGRPRFKPAHRGLHSLECKDLCGDLRPAIEDGVCVGVKQGRTNTLRFAPIKPAAGRKASALKIERGRLHRQVAEGRVLSVRLVKNVVRGKSTFRAQFVMDGNPPQRHEVGTGRVSIDLGPSFVAVVERANPGSDPLASDTPITGAGIRQLAEGASDYSRKIRRLQRKLDRQHRAGSPDCFRPDGTHKTGCEWRDRSKNARQTQSAIAEIHRRLAAYRKTTHGTMVTGWLSVGPYLHLEKLNYVAWQKNFPRSVRDRAPGELIEIARRRAASAGGKAYEYSTWMTALSQTCLCGRKEKKPLSQRTHHCPDCGLVVQRDLLSAYLGMFVRPEVDPTTGEIVGDTLDLDDARKAWSTGPDVDWLAKPSGDTPKHRVRRQQHPSLRSLERIKARRKRCLTSDRGARQEPLHPSSTAQESS